jgi:hypothetical protein
MPKLLNTNGPTPLFINTRQFGEEIVIEIIHENGELISGGTIGIITKQGRLQLCPNINEEVAARAGIKTDDAGRIQII